MSALTLCFALFLLFICSSAITFEMDQYQYFCLFKHMEQLDTFSGSYVASGYDESAVSLTIKTPQNILLQSFHRQKEGHWNVSISVGGEHRLCFQNTRREHISVTVEMHIVDSNDQELSKHPAMVTASDIEKASAQLIEVRKMLWKIRANLKFQSVRGDVHKKNIRSLEKRTAWSTIYKACVLILISIGQVYILTNMIKHRIKAMV